MTWSATLRTWATHPFLALLFRLNLGGLFIYASMNKISYPADFAQTVASYQILPYYLTPLTAIVLPWVELICGILLVAGFRIRSASLAVMFMLLLFILALIWALALDIPIGCGCFHNVEPPISPKTLARDLVWLGMAVHVYRYDRWLQLERSFYPPEVAE